MDNVDTSEIHSSHFRGLWVSCYYAQKNLNPNLFPRANIPLQSRFPYSPDRPTALIITSVESRWSKIASRSVLFLDKLTFCVSEDRPTAPGPCP